MEVFGMLKDWDEDDGIVLVVLVDEADDDEGISGSRERESCPFISEASILTRLIYRYGHLSVHTISAGQEQFRSHCGAIVSIAVHRLWPTFRCWLKLRLDLDEAQYCQDMAEPRASLKDVGLDSYTLRPLGI